MKPILFILPLLIIIAGCETEDLPKKFPQPTTCPGTETVEYAGKTYTTVLVNDQCWLAQNLDVGKQLTSRETSSNNDTIEKYCYNNDSINCEKFGGFYQWDELMQYSPATGAQGICPSGWHIPNQDEFAYLINYVEAYTGYLMKNDSAWGRYIDEVNSECSGCLNATGFDLLPAGNAYLSTVKEFRALGEDAFLWTSSSNLIKFHKNDFNISDDILFPNNCFSVRCIKDQ